MPNPAVFRGEGAERQKRCPKCGEWKRPAEGFSPDKRSLASGEQRYTAWCKACRCERQKSYSRRRWGPDQVHFTAYIRSRSVRTFLSYLRGKAIQRLGSCISIDDLVALWAEQQGRCALTRWPMTMQLAKGVIPTNCSIDRRDSKQGYVTGNVQLVCRAVNVAKSDLPTADFHRLCAAVAEVLDGQESPPEREGRSQCSGASPFQEDRGV